ncbi:hypothetical protein ElyMa_004727100 [Elysia marginata]|uniref:Secreted protein n=1 Tax=Elysia marginata TaxID=1093978 RepID=A0AAV4IA50_9GAST|nr:hypothetical protein ElyMa_004727100 [Elysia marginata]
MTLVATTMVLVVTLMLMVATPTIQAHRWVQLAGLSRRNVRPSKALGLRKYAVLTGDARSQSRDHYQGSLSELGGTALQSGCWLTGSQQYCRQDK